MLYVSLAVSGLLLIAAKWAARGKHPVGGTFGAIVIAVIVVVCLPFTMPTVLLQAAHLTAALLALRVPGWGRRLFVPASLTATIAAYGVTGWFAYERQREFAKLREEMVESMEDRLPARPLAVRTSAPADTARLMTLENAVDSVATSDTHRNWWLRRLHEDQVDEFVNSPGFGVGRLRPVQEAAVRAQLHDRPPVPQPGPGPDRSPPDRWEPVAGSHFDTLHEASVLDFVNPAGFGLVKDRTRVLGFQKHGFSKVPGPADTWTVGAIDLIGLLLHPEPVGYVSANLPRMDELRDAPTRPLDPFEAEGLERLRGGKDLFVRGSDKAARMLGAVRSTKQCLVCHGGDRGDLLGAFSYTLRRGE